MEQPLPIHRATRMHEAGVDASTLRRRLTVQGPGRLVRIGPNAFVDGDAWDAAGPRRRYVTRVHARLARLRPPTAGSHVSALAVHDLPWIDPWPDDVHVTVPRGRRHANRPGLVLHSRPLEPHDIVRVGSLLVTAPARTVVDIALTASTRAAVVTVDAALRSGMPRALLTAKLDAQPHPRAHRAAAEVLRFADARSDSAAESLGRVVFAEIGLPTPVLQQGFRVDGARYRVDFWFPEHGVVIEIDGRAKYSQGRHHGGRTTAQVIVDEKRRHEALLLVPGIRHIVRLEWRDLFDHDRLVRRLRAAGLPCGGPPASSAVGVRLRTGTRGAA